MSDDIKKNDNCFIGMPSCGYFYESAKSCFVACPSDAEYNLKVDVIKNIVESKQYECHIALKRDDPGNFAFCTKICSKIIQSKFCIVLLEPSKKGKAEYPNPNVHFEYGMMISQNKFIIPLQDEKHDLSFNISPLDTIKYNDTNFKQKVTEIINNAIGIAEGKQAKSQVATGVDLVTYYNIHGYQFADIKDGVNLGLYNFGNSLGFFLFVNRSTIQYKYFAAFDNEDPRKAILNTKLLIDNIISTYLNIISDIKENNKEELDKFEYLIKDISIDIIISPFYDKPEVLNKINSIIRREYSYPISVLYRTDYEEFVKKEYENIGNLKILK